MQILTFEKKFLLGKLEENRDRHQKIFNESLIAYRGEVIDTLDTLSDEFEEKITTLIHCIEVIKKDESKTDDYTDRNFSIADPFITKPANHLIDYDRTILMIDNCQQNDIELTEREYSQYVMDDWAWQETFMTANSGWSVMAASGCVDMGY